MNELAYLSYARANITQALRLYNDLRARGIKIWLEARSLTNFDDPLPQVQGALEECPNFVLLLTPEAQYSDYAWHDVHWALALQKRFIVLDCGGLMPPNIGGTIHIDFHVYADGFKQLVSMFPEQVSPRLSVEAVRVNLQSDDDATRKTALYIVGTRRLHELLDLSADLLTDSNADIRTAAAWALGELRNPETLLMLVQALYDASYDVRSAAGWGLVYLGQQVATPVIEVLRDKQNPAACEMAYQVLSRIGGPQAAAALRQYGQTDKGL
jgi:hypothetical protein